MIMMFFQSEKNPNEETSLTNKTQALMTTAIRKITKCRRGDTKTNLPLKAGETRHTCRIS